MSSSSSSLKRAILGFSSESCGIYGQNRTVLKSTEGFLQGQASSVLTDTYMHLLSNGFGNFRFYSEHNHVQEQRFGYFRETN
jgi:hypothetical protein